MSSEETSMVWAFVGDGGGFGPGDEGRRLEGDVLVGDEEIRK